MSTWAFGLPAVARTNVWLTCLTLLIWMPFISQLCFYVFFFFFYVEEKHEVITYEEFLEDYVLRLETDISEDLLKIFKQQNDIRKSSKKSERNTPKFYADTPTKSSDFDCERNASTWDDHYTEYVTEIMDNVLAEWEYIGDTEAEAGLGLSLKEMEYQYFFFLTQTLDSHKALENKHQMAHNLTLSNSGVYGRSFSAKQSVFNPTPKDVRLFFHHKDDFRSYDMQSITQKNRRQNKS